MLSLQVATAMRLVGFTRSKHSDLFEIKSAKAAFQNLLMAYLDQEVSGWEI